MTLEDTNANQRTTPLQTSGILYKRSDHIKKWRQRYVQLNNTPNDQTLRYYYDKDSTSSPPRGVIPIPYGSVLKCLSRDLIQKDASSSSDSVVVLLFPFEVQYKILGEVEFQVKRLLLAATSEEDRGRWITMFLKRSVKSNKPSPSKNQIPYRDDANLNDESGGAIDVAVHENKAKAVFDSSECFQNVSSDLCVKLNSSLEHFLQMCDEPLESWVNDDDPAADAKVFTKRGVSVVQRTMPNANCQIVRGDAVVPHHPKLVFDAILDLNKKKAYEKHLSCAVRLKHLNSQTFIDYLRYVAWPTTARDFCYLLHWRCLPERNNSIAIVAINYDDPDLCPHRDDAIRGEIFLSGYLLTPIQDENGNISSCKFQRISAINVKGIVPSVIIKSMDQSSALFPSKVSRYLTASSEEGLDKSNHNVVQDNIITTETLIDEVILNMPYVFDSINDEKAPESLLPSQSQDLSFEDSESDSVDNEFEPEPGVDIDTRHTNPTSYIPMIFVMLSIGVTPLLVWTISSGVRSFYNLSSDTLICIAVLCSVIIAFLAKSKFLRNRSKPKFESYHSTLMVAGNMLPTVLSLVLPLYLQILRKSTIVPHIDLCLIFSIFCAIRYSAKFCLGSPLIHTTSGVEVGLFTHRNLGTGLVTCRFNVDLRRILKYVSDKKKYERQPKNFDQNYKRHDISVTHVCIQAVAKALSDVPSLNARRIDIPLLGIQGFYPNKTVDVSVSTSGTARDTVKLANIRGATTREIANQLASKSSKYSASKRHESAIPELLQIPLDLISETFDVGNEKSIFLRGKKFGSCTIITSPDTAGQEVDIDILPSREGGAPSVVVVLGGIRLVPSNGNSPKSGNKGSHPSLSFSISIDSPACGVMACRKFVERVQKLLLNPESIEPSREVEYPSVL